MKLNDDLHVLALPFVSEGQTTLLNLSLIRDGAEGLTLVDAGLPGQADAIAQAVAEAGGSLQDLRRIVLTHQDIDHVGALHDVAEASRAGAAGGARGRPPRSTCRPRPAPWAGGGGGGGGRSSAPRGGGPRTAGRASCPGPGTGGPSCSRTGLRPPPHHGRASCSTTW